MGSRWFKEAREVGVWVIFARSTRQARLEDGTVQLVGGLGGSEAGASPCEAKVGLMLQGCLLRSRCCEHLVAVKSQGSKRPSVSIDFQNFDDVDNAIYDQEIVLMCSVGIQMFRCNWVNHSGINPLKKH